MLFSRTRSATFTLLLGTSLLLAVCGPAAAANAPKLVVSSPSIAPTLAGNVTVSASLKSNRNANVTIARFYVNGRLVTTDRTYPFAIKRGFKFDTRTLPTSKPYLDFLLTYEQRKKPGTVAKKSINKRVRLSFIAGSNPKVNAKDSGPHFDPAHPGYPLAFDEEFNSSTLDTSTWNDQRQDSIDENDPTTPALSRPFNIAEGAAYSPDNVSVTDGALNLKLSDTPAPDPSAAGLSRSTGMVNSRGKFAFKYGYVETRAWVPECAGCWPSFWIMPNTDDHWPPEIDIFEYFQFHQYSKTYPHSVFHWAPDGDAGDDQFEWHTSATDSVPSPKDQEWFVTHPAGETGNYYNSWHTYGLHWEHDYAEVFVDGKLGARVNGASKLPHEPMYLIYMMAICRIDGTQCQADDSTPDAGNGMKVDYLRVYSDSTT